MKNLIIILTLSLAFVSCKKEVFEPLNQTEKSEPSFDAISISSNNLLTFDFVFRGDENYLENLTLNGEMRIYVGSDLVATIDPSTISLIDTIVYGETRKIANIQHTITSSQLTSSDGWLTFQFSSDNTIQFMECRPKLNGKMTFVNNNLLFLEPAFTNLGIDFTEYSNKFWVKRQVITPHASNTLSQ